MTEKKTLKAKSSKGEPYDVDFLINNNALSIHCTCQAGEWNKLCKHKIAFIDGDASMLSEDKALEDLENISKTVRRTRFQKILSEMRSKEKESESIKKEISKIKSRLEKNMKDGLALDA